MVFIGFDRVQNCFNGLLKKFNGFPLCDFGRNFMLFSFERD